MRGETGQDSMVTQRQKMTGRKPERFMSEKGLWLALLLNTDFKDDSAQMKI